MKKLLLTLAILSVITTFAKPLPDADFYLEDSVFNNSVSADEFLSKANKSKPLVLYLHGSTGKSGWDLEAKKYYMEMGAYFVYPDSGSNGTYRVGNNIIYVNDMKQRIKDRVQEMNQSVSWLKEKGFEKIIVVGHSEGAGVASFLRIPVYAEVVHGFTCSTNTPPGFTQVNRMLQLISLRDPVLDASKNSTGDPLLGDIKKVSCEKTRNSDKVKTIFSNAESHHPFADPNWKAEVNAFINN